MKNLILLSLILFISCAKQNDVNNQKIVVDKQSISYFADNLKADMNYDTIVATFGAPSKDTGSGIHIYVYPLSDSTEIWIGYANKILYARQVDGNHQVIKTLI
jgi:hypothetical protein